MEQYSMAQSEMVERDQKLRQVESLNNSIRLELLSSDTERRNLSNTVTQQEREISQVRCDLKQGKIDLWLKSRKKNYCQSLLFFLFF